MSDRKILLVGAGQAGLRFLRACMVLAKSGAELKIVGIVESCPERRKQLANQLNLGVFESLSESRRLGLRPDAAIVTVPEPSHAEVLLQLAQEYPELEIAICEKPLTHTLEEAQAVAHAYKGKLLTVNFVERYSPAIEHLICFLRNNNRKILRASCWWGKYRIKDARPTKGVVSVELAHPVDLLLYLCEVAPGTPYHINGVISGTSNFSTGDPCEAPLDSIYASLTLDNKVHIFISSSLLWSQRDRRIELIVGNERNEATEIVRFIFDSPAWDIDTLEIYDITAQGGALQLIEAVHIKKEYWPEEKFTIGKVCNFLEAALNIRNVLPSVSLPNAEHCVYVQEILTKLELMAQMQAFHQNIFTDPEIHDQNSVSKKLTTLQKMEDNTLTDKAMYIWDKNY
ncbi:Gfo/Idh/MocA family protein [Methylobacter luteus]|uniref:Gfo/Idh/MocA family protein n=1 Tax=Methylobacter luteus TaxID=415 RepID=UPI000408E46B|nr:Gfo/Idh/MocA family oxidoreductase [Methylobacter luteus]